MTEIDYVTGSRLMRLWGVLSWPDYGDFCRYWLWEGCCVFVTINHGDHTDLHMAMRPKDRSRCREAVSAILSLIGDKEIHAPIRLEHKKVCNLAAKFGFKKTWSGEVEYIDGTRGELILMKRSAHGRHY